MKSTKLNLNTISTIGIVWIALMLIGSISQLQNKVDDVSVFGFFGIIFGISYSFVAIYQTSINKQETSLNDLEEMKLFHNLKEKEILSEEEFQMLKEKIIERNLN